jgi:oxygen-independent coproporphyrinogen-3 oxidase
LGIQTLSNELWPVLGRVGSIEESKRVVDMVLDTRIELSTDLLAGIPIEREKIDKQHDWLMESVCFLANKVSHISIYDLTIEESTEIARAIRHKRLMLPEDDALAVERIRIDEYLQGQGFQRYEVSNYAKPRHECQHNLAYWQMKPYIGLGSGAVSTIQYRAKGSEGRLASMLRITGTENLDRFIANPTFLPQTIEYIDSTTSLFEFLMMGFRTARGVDTMHIFERFGVDLEACIARTLYEWRNEIVRNDTWIALKPHNFDILNRFLVSVLEELEERQT